MALAPLGYDLVMEVSSKETGGASQAGFGAKARPQFWIGSGKPIKGRVHFAFAAKDRDAVDGFYAAALKAGGKDNGAPVCGPTITPITTVPLCWTPTATTSRPCAICRRDGWRMRALPLTAHRR